MCFINFNSGTSREMTKQLLTIGRMIPDGSEFFWMSANKVRMGANRCKMLFLLSCYLFNVNSRFPGEVEGL